MMSIHLRRLKGNSFMERLRPSSWIILHQQDQLQINFPLKPARSPYTDFNSHAKQQLRGTVSAFTTNTRYNCLRVYVCSQAPLPFILLIHWLRIVAMRQCKHVEDVPTCGNSGFHSGRVVAMVLMKCSVLFKYDWETKKNPCNDQRGIIAARASVASPPLPP